MQTTYLKHNASTLLKTARVAPSKSGCYEVWVTVPKLGECLARIWSRGDGWGGRISDVLGLENGHGDKLSLATTPRSLARLEALVAECEEKQLSALRAEGHLI